MTCVYRPVTIKLQQSTQRAVAGMCLRFGLISSNSLPAHRCTAPKEARWPADGKLRNSHHGEENHTCAFTLGCPQSSKREPTRTHSRTQSTFANTASPSSGCTRDPEGTQGNVHSHPCPPTLSPVAPDCVGGCLTSQYTRLCWPLIGCLGCERSRSQRSAEAMYRQLFFFYPPQYLEPVWLLA